VNKGINNLNGVFSGVTRYNWCSELIKEPEYCTIYIHRTYGYVVMNYGQIYAWLYSVWIVVYIVVTAKIWEEYLSNTDHNLMKLNGVASVVELGPCSGQRHGQTHQRTLICGIQGFSFVSKKIWNALSQTMKFRITVVREFSGRPGFQHSILCYDLPPIVCRRYMQLSSDHLLIGLLELCTSRYHRSNI
jgi:hypothetical protein